MSISHVEGRLDQLAAQPLETYEVRQSPAELEARYIEATQRLQQLCDPIKQDGTVGVSYSGNNIRIDSKPVVVKEYETARIVTTASGEKEKRPMTAEIYATATRTFGGTPRLATSKDPGGIKPGEERYVTDYTKPWKRSENFSVSIFTRPNEDARKQIHQEVAIAITPSVSMGLLKDNAELWTYAKGWLLARKVDTTKNDDEFLKEVVEHGLVRSSWHALIMDIKLRAPDKIRDNFRDYEPKMNSMLQKKIEEEFERKTHTYYQESTVSWTAVPPHGLTVERVEEIERAVKYARGEPVIPPEPSIPPEDKGDAIAVDRGSGPVLDRMVSGIEGTNRRLEYLTSVLLHAMGANPDIVDAAKEEEKK